MARTGTDCVYLDVTHLPPEHVSARFPQIYRYCLEHGLDITDQPIPVSPAAHYIMGGVRTNVWGETTLPGLYACGECACTGVHGANRLASNSLLETVVFARRVVDRSRATGDVPAALAPSPDARSLLVPSAGEGPPATLDALQTLMWSNVGIVRDGSSLKHAGAALRSWDALLPTSVSRADHELANLIACGRLAAEAALAREESRGAHFRLDFPGPTDSWRRHVVFRRDA
jgi:L-aspartate oxidase